MRNAYELLNEALAGDVIVNIGQISPDGVKLLDRAVRAGQLVKWRGKWFPYAGAPFGMGPDKTCWGRPEVRDHVITIQD